MDRQYKQAECTTIIFFLQTDAGTKQWPLTDEAVKEIEENFADPYVNNVQ